MRALARDLHHSFLGSNPNPGPSLCGTDAPWTLTQPRMRSSCHNGRTLPHTRVFAPTDPPPPPRAWQEFIALDGVIATDMRLNQAGSITLDNDTHSVLPSQNEGCLKKLRDVKQKYDPSNLFCYASLSKK